MMQAGFFPDLCHVEERHPVGVAAELGLQRPELLRQLGDQDGLAGLQAVPHERRDAGNQLVETVVEHGLVAERPFDETCRCAAHR